MNVEHRQANSYDTPPRVKRIQSVSAVFPLAPTTVGYNVWALRADTSTTPSAGEKRNISEALSRTSIVFLVLLYFFVPFFLLFENHLIFNKMGHDEVVMRKNHVWF